MGRPIIPVPLFDRPSADQAYILGFWWADGCIGDNKKRPDYRVEFTSADKDHLLAIASCLGGQSGLRFSGGAYRITLGRKVIWGAIKRQGGMPAKSLTATWPSPPAQYFRDFVRGYVDGDGSLGFDGLNRGPWLQIVGTRAFLEGLSRQVYDATGIAASKVYQYKAKVPSIRYTGLKAKCMAAWLYMDSLLRLERKYLLAMQFMHWMPRRFGFKQRVITPKMQALFGELLCHADG